MDDVRGGAIYLKLTRAAREEEMNYLIDKKKYKLAKVQECWEKTGKAPTTIRWVDTNKGSEEEPVIRSRLVARDFLTRG